MELLQMGFDILSEMINSGNYNYNYAHSFFGKDLKNVNIKVMRREKRRTS